VQAALLDFAVAAPNGRPATFTPWYGALAHAIFFRAGSLDYYHTHVCAPGATGCASILGAAETATGSSSTSPPTAPRSRTRSPSASPTPASRCAVPR